MKLLASAILSASLLCPTLTFAQADQAITITRSGAQPSREGPADNFTGKVRVDPLFQTRPPARGAGSYVTFEPGARSAWHTHPLGQTLVVTAGTGRVQRWGGPVDEIRQGDVVWIPAGQKHWHGATPASAMTHIAITESLNGKAVDWMEKVSDGQYGAMQPASSQVSSAQNAKREAPVY